MTSRRTYVLAASAVLAALCGGLSARFTQASPGADGPVALGAALRVNPMADRAEQVLEGLPWNPDVLRADLGASRPTALTAIYLMREDLIVVDATGRLFCLSRRDLTPRWISTLRYPLAAPPAEGPLHYVFVEKDTQGASWVQAFSRRSGAEAERSPIRLPFAASSGISASATTAFVGSYGSPVDNKTMESIDLLEGSIGWGFRTSGRITGTPTVDPQGESVIVVSEDKSVTAIKAESASARAATILWEAQTLGANVCSPTLTKDLAFIGSDDNFIRCYDIHNGMVRWMKGVDAPIRKAPWLLGAQVAREVETAGPGSPKVVVESFEGMVFVKNSIGLHAFDAATGAEIFKDARAARPLVKVGDWIVTIDDAKNAQLRKGKDGKVEKTVALGAFDFLPTNQRDGVIVAGFGDGTILIAVPK